MQYSANGLATVIKNKARSKSTLMVAGTLTDPHIKMCDMVGEAVAEKHNAWQGSAVVNNIQVFGGTCGNLSALSSGQGLGAPGSILGTMSGTGNNCASKFPNADFPAQTDAMTSYMQGVGAGFEQIFNSFMGIAIVSNIEVSGGMCTTTLVLGAPIPGTYAGGDGVLSKLEGNISGIFNAGLLKTAMLGGMNSAVLVNGIPTDATNDSIDAFCEAFQEYHETWMAGTQITGLLVNGGLTIVNAPIVGAIGLGGKFQ